MNERREEPCYDSTQGPRDRDMAESPKLSPQQVSDAIRAGLREGRQPVDMSADEGSQQAGVYRRNLAHCRGHVRKSLDEGDYLQAAEKSWGAFAQSIKAVAADHRLRLTHHASIMGVADHLALLAGSLDTAAGQALRQGLLTARSLHQHWHEDDLSDTTVTTSTREVMAAIDLLQGFFPVDTPAP